MAHETLKTLITNNIKTNGQNAITAQILQDVLIAMVDEYPDISGYATRTWVQQQDFAPKDWVENKHYATQDWANLKFNNYLPLEGGTMAGPITYGNNTEGKYEFFSQGLIFSIGAARYAEGVSIGLDEGLPYIHFFWRGGQLIGTEITRTNVTSGAFIKREGTSAQFLKADGSVDDNAYLPVVNGTVSVSSGDMDIYSAGQQGGFATVFEAKESQDVVFMGSPSYLFDGDVHASAFIKTNGTSDEVLCADGSVKTLSELKAALNAI